MTPATNLAVAAAICLVLVVLLRPRRGLLWHWARGRRATERVRIEDALKHLYDCEYARESATLDSLAGALEIGRDEAARLTTRLEALGLLTSEHRRLTLTPEGCSYALRVIRIHRLLESYLAERTGVDESEWHQRADQMEHRVTAAEAEALSAQLGNPTYDPHGDPIPTADGVMPSRRGLPLSALKTGAVARIVHVEDEPDEVYAQLVAARLSPGVTLRVLDSKPDRMRIEAEWQEHVLAPVVAANLTVEPLSDVAERVLPDQPAVIPGHRPAGHGGRSFPGLPRAGTSPAAGPGRGARHGHSSRVGEHGRRPDRVPHSWSDDRVAQRAGGSDSRQDADGRGDAGGERIRT